MTETKTFTRFRKIVTWSSLGLVAYCGLMRVGMAGMASDRPNIVVADFEGATFGEGWTSEGNAFYGVPMPVGKYDHWAVGKGFVKTSVPKGDTRPHPASAPWQTGKLISPPFKIERPFLNAIIGGNCSPGKLGLRLVVDGQPVAEMTGRDLSHRLNTYNWQSVDVSAHVGKTGHVEIIDEDSTGFTVVDQIELGDTARVLPVEALRRTVMISERYLLFPIKNDAPDHVMRITIDGKVVEAAKIRLAPGEPDWWASMDYRAWRGKLAVVEMDELELGSRGLTAIEPSASLRGKWPLYGEPLRPQYHFTVQRGWNNDPNGLVYHDGEYHLFWQADPFGVKALNKYWGHAVSRDLVHWQELGIALKPNAQARGDCYSGSAVVDHHNSAGFQTGKEKALVAVFLDTGRGASLAYSTDRGRSFTYFEKNPVCRGGDPKAFWYSRKGATGHWVLVEGGFNILTSTNLQDWTLKCSVKAGFSECPELQELRIRDADGKLTDRTKWMMNDAKTRYILGEFDGEIFTPDDLTLKKNDAGLIGATQVFNDVPDGRRIRMGWQGCNFPGMPWNQAIGLPLELSLRETPAGLRVQAYPVGELEMLREPLAAVERRDVTPGQPLTIPLEKESYLDAELELEFPQGVTDVTVRFGEATVVYDSAKKELKAKPGEYLDLMGGKLHLRLLKDGILGEMYANYGQVGAGLWTKPVERIEVSGAKPFVVKRASVYRMKSIWPAELKSVWPVK